MLSSKKIILTTAALLGLATQSHVSAYNVAQLKDEVMLIERYAIYCDAGLSRWLLQTTHSTYLTSNKLIVTIAGAIKDHHNDKLFDLRHEDQQKWRSYEAMVKAMVDGAFVGLCLGLTCTYLEEIAMRWLANHDAQLLAQAQQLFNANAAIINNQAKKK